LNINATNRKTLDEMKVLTDLWLEDLGGLNPDLFLEAVKLHRQRSQFFPSTAEILKTYGEITNRPKEFNQIEYRPERVSKEELVKILKPYRDKRKAIKDLLGGMGS